MFIYACMYLSGCIMTWFLHLFPSACSHFSVFLHLCLHSVIFRYCCVFYSLRLWRKLFFICIFIFWRCKCKMYASAIRDIMFEAFPFFPRAGSIVILMQLSSSGSKIIYSTSRTSSRLPFVCGKLLHSNFHSFSCCFVLMVIYWMRLTTTSNLRDVATESVLAEKPATTIFFLKWKLFSKNIFRFLSSFFSVLSSL